MTGRQTNKIQAYYARLREWNFIKQPPPPPPRLTSFSWISDQSHYSIDEMDTNFLFPPLSPTKKSIFLLMMFVWGFVVVVVFLFVFFLYFRSTRTIWRVFLLLVWIYWTEINWLIFRRWSSSFFFCYCRAVRKMKNYSIVRLATNKNKNGFFHQKKNIEPFERIILTSLDFFSCIICYFWIFHDDSVSVVVVFYFIYFWLILIWKTKIWKYFFLLLILSPPTFSIRMFVCVCSRRTNEKKTENVRWLFLLKHFILLRWK